ncbi:MAG: hypothetical protein ABJB66_19115 [Gemmatimonadaceae bacterium]
MTSTSRSSNSSTELLRAPYAAPQLASPLPSPFAPKATTNLAPFVPQDYRDSAVRAATVAASVEPPAIGTLAIGNVVVEPETSSENVSSLPWIEAFVQDAGVKTDSDEHVEPVSEDTWPMGEAAKRLDELTESLTSIDASRALLNAAEKSTSDSSPESRAAAAHPMWNDDEWMDIMPTSSVVAESVVDPIAEASVPHEWQADSELEDLSASDNAFDIDAFAASEPSGEDLARPDIANVDFSEAMSASHQYAEITARALEGLAQRVRSGDVPVPAVQQDLGDAAVLAGVLASLLGWRR